MAISRNIEDFNDITAPSDLVDIQRALHPTAGYRHLFFKYTQNINQDRIYSALQNKSLWKLKII